jgi:CDP-glucose 4,6-dehydratase
VAIRQGTVEALGMSFWSGKRVLVTGHTGFKGAWLSLWLTQLGAHVTGLSLPPDTKPALFDLLGLAKDIDHRTGDIRDADLVKRALAEAAPDVVLHLAAQALVLRGYREPLETWHTNVMGTAHVLEAIRALDKPCVAVLITTDKVYQNNEWEFSYRESDRLGGHDPYSASKAASELVISSWRQSYFGPGSPVRIASARAGNVIGGGDWAENRIIPDLIKAVRDGRPVKLRNPHAVRPWQHVLEPLGGYLLLAQRLAESDRLAYQDSFNFGPAADAERTVGELVKESLQHWPGSVEDVSVPGQLHEASRLALSIERARSRLGWEPLWNFSRTVQETINWYRDSTTAAPRELTLRNIRDYEQAMRDAGVSQQRSSLT